MRRVSPQVFLQLNLYAHQRFPQNLTFVRNLLRAYKTHKPAIDAAWESLLREYWYFDAESALDVFRISLPHRPAAKRSWRRSSRPPPTAGEQRWHQLARENSAAAEYIAEARVWRSHFEEAAPVMLALATDLPAEEAYPSALHRFTARWRMTTPTIPTWPRAWRRACT